MVTLTNADKERGMMLVGSGEEKGLVFEQFVVEQIVADRLAAEREREPNCPTHGCRARWDASKEHTCDVEALYERVEFLRDQLERVTQERADAHAAIAVERERIAQAIEALGVGVDDDYNEALADAARIARGDA